MKQICIIDFQGPVIDDSNAELKDEFYREMLDLFATYDLIIVDMFMSSRS
jgi:hypothetical protein